jgi:predicted Zn-dependent protease
MSCSKPPLYIAIALLLVLLVQTPVATAQQRTTVQGQIQQQATVTSRLSSPDVILLRLKTRNNLPLNITTPEVQVQQADFLNAATNGQSILITTGLLNRLKTDDQLAFVLSHELAHVALNHIQKTQMRRVGLTLLDQVVVNRVLPQGTVGGLLGDVGLSLLDKRFSRNVEFQADDLGMQLHTKAGYNPEAAIQVFRILQAASPNRMPEFLQSHPISDSRIRMLVQKYKLAY